MAAEDAGEARLESPLPARPPAGTASAVFVSGVAPSVPRLGVAGGPPRPAAAAGMPRFDARERRSGFWSVLDVPGGEDAAAVWAELGGVRRELGRLAAPPPAPAPLEPGALAGRSAGAAELICVCLATHEPDPELFARQLASLRAQSDRDWVCVVSDDASSPAAWAEIVGQLGADPRFAASRSGGRIGFYRNFERALALAPAQAGLIALCDQDDVWHPDKLAALRAALAGDPGAVLAYSDMRLVTRDGRVLRETLWRGRANNRTSMASLLVANTVTGAAALLRREVAAAALPFPDSPGIEFHDHWLAVVALARGRLAYVDRPLYDYVQHSGAILGKVASGAPRAAPRRARARLPRAREWRSAYFLGYVAGAVRARTVLLRCGEQIAPRARRDLERYLAAEGSWPALLWLLVRPVRAVWGRSETLAGEWELARGVVWFRAARLLAGRPWWPEQLLLDCRWPEPARFEMRRLRRWRELL